MGRKIAIVTGASSGLGREFIRLLAKEPQLEELWAIARHQEGLDRLKEELGERVRTFSVDLSSIDAIRQWAIQLENVEVQWLVNNAGYAKFGVYSDLSIEDSANMIDLNCGGVVAMALACLPHMGPGSHMVNIASQAAFQPLPYQNLYSATKAFVRSWSRALHVELKSRGITATAVCPGWIRTRLYERADIGAKRATNRFVGMVEPRQVAAKALADAKKGRDMSVYSLYVKLGHLAAKLLPQRAMMWIWSRQQGL